MRPNAHHRTRNYGIRKRRLPVSRFPCRGMTPDPNVQGLECGAKKDCEPMEPYHETGANSVVIDHFRRWGPAWAGEPEGHASSKPKLRGQPLQFVSPESASHGGDAVLRNGLGATCLLAVGTEIHTGEAASKRKKSVGLGMERHGKETQGEADPPASRHPCSLDACRRSPQEPTGGAPVKGLKKPMQDIGRWFWRAAADGSNSE